MDSYQKQKMPTATPSENIANYKTSLTVFKKWNGDGIISAAELAAAEERIAKKYGLAAYSIYREGVGSVGNCNQEQPLCVQALRHG